MIGCRGLCCPNTIETEQRAFGPDARKRMPLGSNHLTHPNIIQLLGSYTHHDDHCLLFPLFQIDLEEFLCRGERLEGFQKDFMFYTALQGLSSAVEKVHSLNLSVRDHDIELARIGYHHNIRPANALVDSRAFYLADFGLGKMKLAELGSQTKWKAGLGEYVALECMNEGLIRQKVGRPLDIWSFGCMLFEIAAYMRGKPSGIKEYRALRLGPGRRRGLKDRYFFSGNKLKPSVTTWYKKFEDKTDSGMPQNLLDTAELMLRTNPAERSKAADVHQSLSFLSVNSLFNAVQQAFDQYLKETPGKTDETTTQLESKRLAAWGNLRSYSSLAT
jgi:serine/threonine protein kinase